MPPLFTVGYESVSLEALVASLREHVVTTLVDVRELPLSRRPGFSKLSLAAALELNGIAYRHERALGTPRDLRHGLRAGLDWPSFRSAYLALLEERRPDLERVAALASRERVALLCFEADPGACHRSLVAEEMLRLGLVETVQHLTPAEREEDRMPTEPTENVGTRLLFENERVRVWDLALEPGEWLERHVHKRDFLFVVVQGGSLRHADPEDPASAQDVRYEDDQVVFVEAHGGTVHERLTNVGTTPYRNYVVELKRG